ncbi:MAG: DUF3099 domain-containing protein [Actinomycetales bacterium]|nr:MAG: DUF3099 domain-containing protein [Actinomycetales bacterium]
MVYSITSAREAHSDELGSREIKYAISMAIRSLCFVGGVICWLNVAVWLGVILMILAVFLPYTSVVMANAGVRKKSEGGTFLSPEPFGEISQGTTGPAQGEDEK